MKKSRIVLNVLAFAFAIGGAYASVKSPLQQGYKFVSIGLPCATSVKCNLETNAICMDQQDQVWNSPTSVGTSCGTLLTHRP
jgi:hypothetical protein